MKGRNRFDKFFLTAVLVRQRPYLGGQVVSAGIQTQALGSGRRIASAAEALLVGPNKIALHGVLPVLICT